MGLIPVSTTASDQVRCGRCGVTCGQYFQLERRTGPAGLCLRCALSERPLLARSFRVALVVGTVLTGINQGEVIASGTWTPALAWKIPLTYTVPFIVAMWGALTSARRRSR